MTDPLISLAKRALHEHPQGEELMSLLMASYDRGRRAEEDRDKHDATAWAFAYIVGEVLDGRPIEEIVDELPDDARRRVIAVRHQGSPFSVFAPRDQHGRLPRPPSRASVMRERSRVYDGHVVLDQREIEGTIVEVAPPTGDG